MWNWIQKQSENFAVNLISNVIWAALICVLGFVAWWLWTRRRRRSFYLPLVLTDSDKFIDQMEEGAELFFHRQQGWRAIPRLKAMDRSKSCVVGLYDPLRWRSLLEAALKTFRKTSLPEHGSPEELHLVFGTPTLWNLALGTLLKNRHNLVLYHFQQVGGLVPNYHRIWQIDRKVKDLKSPIAGRPFAYQLLQRQLVSPIEQPNPARECLVFELGTHSIRDAVVRYRDKHLPDASMRVFTKVTDLSPREPGQWLQAAAEISHALCDFKDCKANDRYVFIDGPCVLALMAGDALGDYTGARLHLMQWNKHDGDYFEILCLPDPPLSGLAG